MKYLLIFLISLAAFFMHGYQFAVSDQEIFIPYIYKYQDQSLFTNDQIFNQISAKASLFYPIFGTVTKFFDIQTVFFLSYLVFNFVFFIVLYKLAKLILNDDKKAFLSLFPFFLPKFIGGTATFTFDTFFGYRSFGVIFLILFLTYLLKGKYVNSAVFAFLGILFHPLSIIPNLLLLPSLVFFNSKKNKRMMFSRYFKWGIVMTLTIVLILGILIPKNNQWLSVIKERDDYLFLSLWTWQGWAAAAMYFFITLVFFNDLSKNLQKLLKIIVVFSLVVFVSYWFTLEVLKAPEIAKLQLLRSISPVAYVGLIVSPLFLFQKKLFSKILGSIAFLSLCLNFFNIFLFSSISLLFLNLINNAPEQSRVKISNPLIVLFCSAFVACYLIFYGSTFLPIGDKIQFPKVKNDWIDIQQWAKLNSNKNAVFLVPPNQTGFRIFSKRTIVGDIKDGAVSMYDKSYAQKWHKLFKDISNYSEFKENNFAQLAKEYYFDFIITSESQTLQLERIYENKSYIIYKSPKKT